MKKKILITTLNFLSYVVFAQDNASTANDVKTKSFIGVTGGYSNLMGNITKTDYADNSSGYANSKGYNIGLEGAYYFHKYFGVGGLFSLSTFNVTNLQT